MPRYTREDYINMVYKFVRDSEPLNKLLNFKKESDPETMALYVDMALDNFNTEPPQTSFTFETFPSMNLLIKGAVIELLISNGLLQSRNRLNYSDGGISVQVSDKAGEYMQWINFLVQDYYRKLMKIKEEINILNGFGDGSGPGDPYRFGSGWW